MSSPRRSLPVDRRVVVRVWATYLALALVYGGFLAALVMAGLGQLIALAIIALVVIVQLRFSTAIALKTVGAREVGRAEDPELHAIVDRLCLAADIAPPRIARASSRVPNALVAGTSSKRLTLCVTDAARALLTPAELEAVVAHELAHVAHRDAAVMTAAAFFGMVAGLMWRVGFRVGHPLARGIALGVTVAASAVSWLLLRVLMRHRELAADHTAGVLTAQPSTLASALIKLDERMRAMPAKDLRAASAVSALCLVPAPAKRAWMRVASTHPPTAARVRALERLEVQLQRAR